MYVAIDTETTGVNNKIDSILSIAAVKFSEEGKIIEKYEKFFKPASGVIPQEVVNIHGITLEKVKDCEVYNKTARDDINKFIRGTELVGHNISFDLGFLKFPKSAMPSKIHDTLIMSRQKWPMAQRHKLANACDRAGISIQSDRYHDALEDTRQCMRLFLFFKYGSGQITLFNDETRIPLEKNLNRAETRERPINLKIKEASFLEYPSDIPSLLKDGSLVIPFACPEEYHWWKPQSKTVSQIVEEISS